MVTQQDIANRLGVSVTTVSLALRNDPQVSHEMRVQVHAVAQELGYLYRPRKAAQTTKIAFVGRYGASSAFYMAVLHGAERVCQQCNVTLQYIRLEEAVNHSLLEDNVDALMLVSSIDPQTIRQFKRLGLPMVLVDNNLSQLGLDRVLIENVGGLERAAATLIEWGHRQILFINGSEDIPSFRDRRRGYYNAMERMGLKPQEMMCNYNSDVEDAQELLSRWLAKVGSVDFTAVLACNDKTAIGMIYALQNAGFRVPDDVSVIGFDDIDMAQIVRPRLTTVHVYRELLGERGVRMLLDRIEYPSRPAMTLTIETSFVERESARRWDGVRAR